MLSAGPYAERLKPATRHKQEAPQHLGWWWVLLGVGEGRVGYGGVDEGVDGAEEPSARDALFLATPREWRRSFNQRER